jgi:hypothetical protein
MTPLPRERLYKNDVPSRPSERYPTSKLLPTLNFMGVLRQGFYKLPPNNAVPSPADVIHPFHGGGIILRARQMNCASQGSQPFGCRQH